MTAQAKTVTAKYLMGITDGRELFKREGMENARAHLDNLERTCFLFAASSPVGRAGFLETANQIEGILNYGAISGTQKLERLERFALDQ